MRYIGYLFLIFTVTLQSCNKSEECNRSLSKDLSGDVLGNWERVTKNYIASSGDDKLIEALQAQENKGISIFDRKNFLNDSHNKIDKTIKYSSLIIIELNLSGERYRRIKYLLISCSQRTTLLKFYLNQGEWELVKTRRLETRKLQDAVAVLKESRDNTVYWGDNFNEIAALSEFQDFGKIKIELFSTLNRKQYEAIWLLEK